MWGAARKTGAQGGTQLSSSSSVHGARARDQRAVHFSPVSVAGAVPDPSMPKVVEPPADRVPS